MWSEFLDVPINHDNEPVETVFLDHGVNFSGSLNMFGGWSPQWQRRFENLAQAKQIYSLEIPCPRYSEILARRSDVNAPSLVHRLGELEKKSEVIDWRTRKHKILVCGDSHGAAWAPPETLVLRRNGWTLHNFLTPPHLPLGVAAQTKKLILCFGNIDVRHHIVRLGADWKAMWRRLKEIGDFLDCEVEYTLPWPIEPEDRKVPKTGWYKGQPFWGSWKERSQLVMDIRHFMEDEGMLTDCYPEHWHVGDHTFRMEKPQSVHLSPEYYRTQSWGETCLPVVRR